MLLILLSRLDYDDDDDGDDPLLIFVHDLFSSPTVCGCCQPPLKAKIPLLLIGRLAAGGRIFTAAQMSADLLNVK